MIEIVDISDVELAFPSTLSKIPTWESIPEEFKDHHPASTFVMNFWMKKHTWDKFRAVPREGVDPKRAFRMISHTLGCWGIKHEHKEAAVGFMLDQFFKQWWVDGEEGAPVVEEKSP